MSLFRAWLGIRISVGFIFGPLLWVGTPALGSEISRASQVTERNILSPGEILKILTEGDDLSPDEQRRLFQQQGVAFSLDGLGLFYTRAMPGVRVTGRLRISQVGSFYWDGTFLNSRSQEPMGFFRISISAREQGAVVLNLEQILVRSGYRGRGMGAYFLDASVALVRALSSHPDSRIMLQAWTGFTSTTGQEFGAYVWAPYGFDVNRNGPRNQCFCSQAQRQQYAKEFGPDWAEGIHFYLLRSAFMGWLERTYLGRDHGITKEEWGQVAAASMEWHFPWDLASFDATPLVHRSVGLFQGKLGKEFLGSPSERVRWQGELFVNRPHRPGLLQYERKMAEVLGEERVFKQNTVSSCEESMLSR